MSDPIAELESQLRDAAVRRATRRRWSRPFGRRVLRRAAVAVAALCALAVLVAGLGGGWTGDERAVAPPPGDGEEVTLTAAVPAKACPGLEPGRVPADLQGFSVFERPQDAPDGSTVNPDQIPVATFDPADTRVAPDPRGVTLVPTAGVRADERCEPDLSEHDGHGICMVSGYEDRAVVSCHTLEEIRTGRALAVMNPRSSADVAPTGFRGVAGVVPDGVQRVILEWPGGRVEANVSGNGYAAEAPELAAGDRVRVTLVRDGRVESERRATCDDPPPPLNVTQDALPDGVLEELPALEAPATASLPDGSAEWLRRFRADRVWLDAARRVAAADGVSYWGVVMANARRCSEVGTVEEYGKPWLACVLAIREDEVVFHFCNGPELGIRGVSSGAVDGRPIVTGICEPDATKVLVEVRGRDEPLEIPVNGGFFGSLLPNDVEPGKVRAAHRCRS